ncbi:phage antirepressor N-terminal domain-containing protein [Chitinibacter sp. FCG-7]|uniref:Phage antirepressor N-terminal domain-containing protein n=1 Tax=Chitinibacter mangrovi TaxID=3153927 RepID=A0AAU7F7X3_9NEIS
MSKAKIKPTAVQVSFAGAVLDGLIVKGVAYVALRPIVEGMGLEWSRQLQRVQDDPVLSANCVHMYTIADDGRQREMLCLPEKYLQGWLFKVNANKVKPGIRDKVIHYQRECYEVLHKAFTQGRADTEYRVMAIDSKRAAAGMVTDTLNDLLLMDGKTPKPHDFSNEHRLINWALTGEFASLDEAALSTEQIKRLSKLRRRDAFLIVKGLDYAQRKEQLKRYADSLDEQARLAA